jgi:hypothetical protein
MKQDASKSILQELNEIRLRANVYFSKVLEEIPNEVSEDKYNYRVSHNYWKDLTEKLKEESSEISASIALLAQRTGPAIRRAPLLTEADEREASHAFKGMRAALRFRDFQHDDVEVLHDEGTVLGVQPARDYERFATPRESAGSFTYSIESLVRVLELSDPKPAVEPGVPLLERGTIAAGYRPGTAFIMMAMSAADPTLTDVCEAIKECFHRYGIEALRADDIEHEDVITQRIIDQIKTAEFLVADLTGERPSVYYEIGYAHALGRRVILYRRAGTSIHFDLAAYNCPEYKNITELRSMLMRRLENITGVALKGS